MLRVLALAAMLSAPAHAAPAHIVSLNPCLDALLVELADRSQIAAVSHYARDPTSSSIAEIAATLPITNESAEEVIALSPDLVITSRHSALATRNALRRLNIQTELFEVPDTVEASEAQVMRIAGLVGHPGRGEDLIARIDAAIAAAKPTTDAPAIPAVLIEPGGFTVGKAGNIALERLIADPPTVLFAGVPDPNKPGWAERILRHPAMRQIGARIMRADYPQRLMYCGGAVLIETAQVLADARKRVQEARP